MNTAVLDTSVIIKWFHRENEDDVDKALLLQRAYLEGALDVIVPDLLVYEFGGFLRFRSGLEPGDAVAAIRTLWSLGLIIHPVDSLLSEQIVDISIRRQVTAYDAAFVALADFLSAPFITADHMLHEKLKDSYAVMHLAQLEGSG